MNSLVKKAYFKRRKLAFLARNQDRMRKPMGVVNINLKCEIPEWLKDDIEYGAEDDGYTVNRYVRKLLEKGLNNSSGFGRLIQSGDERTSFKVIVGGKLANAIRKWSGRKRMSLKETVAELLQWGVMD